MDNTQKVSTVEQSQKKVYSTDPLVETYNNVITDEECQHFIDISKSSLKRSLVSTSKKGVVSAGRTGLNTWIPHNHDEITKRVGERIAKIVNMPLENAEAYQVIYYGVTQEYRQHYDSWNHDASEKTLRCMKFGGSRVKTALCYLNDVKKGGGTRMTKLNVTVTAEKGKLLIFQNTISEDNHDRHPMSEHAGLPVEEGEKFAFNLWFKECNSKRLYKTFNPGYYAKIENSADVPSEDKKETGEKETGEKETEEKETGEKETGEKEQEATSSKKEDEEDGSGDGEEDGSGDGEEDESGDQKKDGPIVINSGNRERLHKVKDIFKYSSFIDSGLSEKLVSNCKFNKNYRRDGWINLSAVPTFIKKLEDATNISKDYFENINVVEYKAGIWHSAHHTAYDLNSEKGKEYTKFFGQRLFTITLILSDNILLRFPKINSDFHLQKDEVLFYKNVNTNGVERDLDMTRCILNKGTESAYIANIYVREKTKSGKFLLGKDYSKNTENVELQVTESAAANEMPSIDALVAAAKAARAGKPLEEGTQLGSSEFITTKAIKEAEAAQAAKAADAAAGAAVAGAETTAGAEATAVKEDYMETLNDVFEKFKNKQVLKTWKGHKSFAYHFKGNFTKFKQYINEFAEIKSKSENNSCINAEHLEKDYNLDPEFPLQVVNNVINDELSNLLKKYYKETIDEKTWPLGDRQSNRYKSHNEPMSRFLHYEILPLIEKIVGRKMRPTYTYLSAYIKDADLPPHTDREDCEFTVSFVVDKPEGSNWNIYVHNTKQPVKHKGRYNIDIPLSECTPVDCEPGGLMMFQGTDRIHFREKLPFDFYNILLLHYRSV